MSDGTTCNSGAARPGVFLFRPFEFGIKHFPAFQAFFTQVFLQNYSKIMHHLLGICAYRLLKN